MQDFIALGNPSAIVSSTATHSLMELMRTSVMAVMDCQISSPASSGQCTGVVFYMSVVIVPPVVETVLGPPTAQLINPLMKLQGAKNSPSKWVYPKNNQEEKIGNYFCSVYFVILAWNKRRFLKCSKMMSRNSIRLIKRTKSNRTYLSCK